MRVDVIALQRFYASPLGGAAVRMVRRRLETLWPSASGLDMLGLGYPTPYLEPYRAQARRVVAMMPGPQGAERWPHDAAGLTALGEEARLPFMDAVFDRVLVAHLLEETDAARAVLREVWRVTAPEGRIVVVAANRAGLWARADSTPFGHGRPYSRAQLAAVLRDSLFEPTASARALYAPPVAWKPLIAAAEGFERVGETAFAGFGGLILMEAVKRLSIPPKTAAPKVVLARARVAPVSGGAASHLQDAARTAHSSDAVQQIGPGEGSPR